MSDFLKRIYSEIARKYEAVNHIFTFGFDLYWRRRLAKMVVEDGGKSALDVCTGTGETARCIDKVSAGSVKIVGADFSSEMLDEAKRRSDKSIEYIYADASNLPFPENSFDAATVSFAARNLNSGEKPLLAYFREICRVLKRGGAFYNLETSQPSNKLVRWVFRTYVKMLVALIGRKFSGNRDGYKYLASSVLTFMGPDELAQILKEAGFSRISYIKLSSGAIAIHKAVK